MIKTQEDFFINICTSHFIVSVRKGLLKVCVWEGVGDRTETVTFDPYSYGRQRCVFLVPQGCSTGGPGVHSAGCWLSLLHLISNFSGPQTPSGSRGPPRQGVAFPTTSRLSPSPTLTGTSVLTELYNSPTSTQSPTRSLESSGNNCHAVHRSLSSGASVYECIMGFTLSHFISQINPRDLFRLLAIGMCHFLPVHHFVMACLLGPKVKIQQYVKLSKLDEPDTRSRDELISDILLWTRYGRAKAIRPARTYIQQLCVDRGYSLENLPGSMANRDGWRQRVREICSSSTTWRWWWWDCQY